MIKKLTDKELEKFLKENSKAVVDMWAPWCAPCKTMEPIFKEAGEEVKEIAFGKVNVADNKAAAKEYGVRSIPTFLIFKDGEVIKRIIGSRKKEDLKKEINKAYKA